MFQGHLAANKAWGLTLGTYMVFLIINSASFHQNFSCGAGALCLTQAHGWTTFNSATKQIRVNVTLATIFSPKSPPTLKDHARDY